MQCDVAHGGWGVAFDGACGGVSGVESDGIGRVADADIVVDDVVGEAAAGAVGLDADSRCRGPSSERSETRILLTPPLVSLPMGHAVSPVEVIVADGHVGDAAGASLDRYVVVSGADVAVRDGDVLRTRAGIDSVGVAGSAPWGCRSSIPTR